MSFDKKTYLNIIKTSIKIMQFPTKYNCLNQNEFKALDYKIVPIRYEDRLAIMKWRNEQMYHLRQNKLLTLKDQNNYFDNVVTKLFNQDEPNQILFSLPLLRPPRHYLQELLEIPYLREREYEA